MIQDPPATTSPTAAGATERFDSIACLDERVRHSATTTAPAPGRYIEVHGAQHALLIPLGRQVTRIGRGVSAELHLDDNSVSRRHAILDATGPVARILDDRSSNGTIVNGEPVQQSELRHGDEIAVGRVLLRFVELV